VSRIRQDQGRLRDLAGMVHYIIGQRKLYGGLR
jgi:hypothetical protein